MRETLREEENQWSGCYTTTLARHDGDFRRNLANANDIRCLWEKNIDYEE